MSYDSIRAAIESTIKASITTVTLAWGNESYDPKAVSKWSRATVMFAGKQREVLTGSPATGQAIYGTVMVNAFVLGDANQAEALKIINLFSTLFNEQTITLSDGTRLFFESGERLSENPDSEWYQLAWSIPFKHDDIA